MNAAGSRRARELPRSGVRQMMELALSVEDAVRLDIGDPDFTTPEHIIDAAARAARAGFTHYGPSGGLPSLRALIADQITARTARPCGPDRVVVGTGAAGVLSSVLLALLDPGDELLVPDPCWTAYASMAHAAGATLVAYPLDRARGFAYDPAAIEPLIGSRTRAILINSPGNPTGAVADAGSMEALSALARRHGVWLISDECYADLVLDGQHVSALAVGEWEHTLAVFSFSKTYAMTGWRVGYAVAPPEVVLLVARVQEALFSCPSTIAQKAAEAALTGGEAAVTTMREAYRARRARALSILDAGDVRYVAPAAAFYLMVDVSPSGLSSEQFAQRLLLDERVSVVPGAAFGAGGEGMVRVSLAAEEATVATGLRRLVAAVASQEDAA